MSYVVTVNKGKGQNLISNYQYNNANLLTYMENRSGTTLKSKYNYSYNLDGNISEKIDTTMTTKYTYDDSARLTSEIVTLSDEELYNTVYTYDAAGNRLKRGYVVLKNKRKKKIIKDYTKIKARFGIYAKELDFDYISELLGIKPTYKMLAKNIKIKEYQEDGWEYDLGYMFGTDINEQVEKVLLLLIDKADVINDICNSFNATTQLSVIVKAKSKKYYPYLSLSNENIERMNKLNISLFDIDLL